MKNKLSCLLKPEEGVNQNLEVLLREFCQRKEQGSNYDIDGRYMVSKDRTGDVISIKQGTSECVMGERDNTNPLCNVQGQHHNDEDPINERGHRRG